MSYKLVPIKSTEKFEKANPECMKWMNEGYNIKFEYYQITETEDLKKIIKKALPVVDKGELSPDIEWYIDDGSTEGIWRVNDVWCCSAKNESKLKEAKFKEIEVAGGKVGNSASSNGGQGKDLLHYREENLKKEKKCYWRSVVDENVICFTDDLGIRAIGEIGVCDMSKLLKGVRGIRYEYDVVKTMNLG